MTSFLLLGREGQIGWELVGRLASLGEVIATNRDELDLTDLRALRDAVQDIAPQVIINAAAYTDVDGAEHEPDLAHRINAEAPGALAAAAKRVGALLVQFSSDYVFAGDGDRPYREGDPVRPINAYGRSKLEGERAVQDCGERFLIMRTSWVYSLRRPCFLTKVLRWARENTVLRIADDQWASPTWCRTVARATAQLLEDDPESLGRRSGIYHLVCHGSVSRFQFAEAILELDPNAHEQRTEALLPAKRADFKALAERPRYSALDPSRLEQTFGVRLPDWKDALRQAMASAGDKNANS